MHISPSFNADNYCVAKLTLLPSTKNPFLISIEIGITSEVVNVWYLNHCYLINFDLWPYIFIKRSLINGPTFITKILFLSKVLALEKEKSFVEKSNKCLHQLWNWKAFLSILANRNCKKLKILKYILGDMKHDISHRNVIFLKEYGRKWS